MIAPCLTEIDISLFDRLRPVFRGSPFVSKLNDDLIPQQQINQTQTQNQNKNGFAFLLESSQIDVRLRFPCTDLRPAHAPNRVPYWKRNILRDSLYLNFREAKISFNTTNKYDILANEIDIFYAENEESEKIHIGNVTKFEETSKKPNQQTQSSDQCPR